MLRIESNFATRAVEIVHTNGSFATAGVDCDNPQSTTRLNRIYRALYDAGASRRTAGQWGQQNLDIRSGDIGYVVEIGTPPNTKLPIRIKISPYGDMDSQTHYLLPSSLSDGRDRIVPEPPVIDGLSALARLVLLDGGVAMKFNKVT